jgi:tetratricopeptide (TPR) repeat protein
MSGKSTRLGAALVMALVCSDQLGAQKPRIDIDPHRQAIDLYVRSVDISGAVAQLQEWTPDDFDRAIEGLVASRDLVRMKAAAILHLDLGVALVGLNTLAAKRHIDIGDHLLNKVRDDLKQTPQIKEHDAFRAIYLSVAGSAFAAVRDLALGMPYAREAHDLLPTSAHVVTVFGIAHEFDALGYNPEDWQTLGQREGRQRERIIRLGRAERAYRQALVLDEHYAIASVRLGRVLHLGGKLQEARSALERGAADARGPFQQYVAALFTARLQQEQDQIDAARVSYERALGLVPTSQPAVVGLAHLELMSGRPDRAQELARQFASRPAGETWWAYHEGALDLPGLAWLRERIAR